MTSAQRKAVEFLSLVMEDAVNQILFMCSLKYSNLQNENLICGITMRTFITLIHENTPLSESLKKRCRYYYTWGVLYL